MKISPLDYSRDEDRMFHITFQLLYFFNEKAYMFLVQVRNILKSSLKNSSSRPIISSFGFRLSSNLFIRLNVHVFFLGCLVIFFPYFHSKILFFFKGYEGRERVISFISLSFFSLVKCSIRDSNMEIMCPDEQPSINLF